MRWSHTAGLWSTVLCSVPVPCCGGLLQDFAEQVSRGDLEGLLLLNTSLPALPAATRSLQLAQALRHVAQALRPRILEPCRAKRQLNEVEQQRLLEAVEEGNQHVVHLSTTLTPPAVGAAAPLGAVLAAVAARTRGAGSVAPDCRMLMGVVPEGSCSQIVNVGLMCLWSLLQAAERAEHFETWAFEGVPLDAMYAWRFRSDLDSDPLGSLLALLPRQGTLRMAEIGVFQADLSSQLLKHLPDLEMLLVDPYHLRLAGVAEDQPQGLAAETLTVAVQRTQQHRNRATHVLQGSAEAAMWVQRSSLDVVYVDGDHSYQGCADDLDAWWPTLRPGGILAGHDYTLIWPGVVLAVNQFAAAKRLVVHFTAEMWWMVKPQT